MRTRRYQHLLVRHGPPPFGLTDLHYPMHQTTSVRTHYGSQFCNLTIAISTEMEIFPILSYRGSRIACAGMPWFVSLPTNGRLHGLRPQIESTNSQDRKTAKLNFTLKNEHLAKLANRSCAHSLPCYSLPANSSHRPRYQLRLYCTSSQYYIQTGTSFRAAVCPIEFPPTCEVRVNSQSLVTNFRGIKKKPGTAPPADITALTKRGTAGLFNQLEMVYVNSAQAVAGKVSQFWEDEVVWGQF